MPKVKDTRKQRAAELLERLKRGPGFSDLAMREPYTPAEASKQFRNWSGSWILAELCQLVPELRGVDPFKKEPEQCHVCGFPDKTRRWCAKHPRTP